MSMRCLTEQEIITIWERGLRQHPIERALTLLTVALPGMARADLLKLSVGQRDAYLILLREQTFGSQFVGFAECQSCREQLEFSFDIANVWMGTAPVEDVGQMYQYHIEGYELEVRLPNSADLLAVVAKQDLEAARTHLLQHCISHVAFANKEVQAQTLPANVVETLGEQLLVRDPQIEVLINLSCPKCEQHWSAVFDIVAFLWSEIQTHAKRILREIHTLALAYGWSESEILALSSIRRQLYLEMVS